mmetsp:Transcript_25337/g.47297  ORF Transcript_25337/g.47297 Transcript_25337/m.47297 type:complete len:108 (-) Transcript_25337:432-755(-)
MSPIHHVLFKLPHFTIGNQSLQLRFINVPWQIARYSKEISFLSCTLSYATGGQSQKLVDGNAQSRKGACKIKRIFLSVPRTSPWRGEENDVPFDPPTASEINKIPPY